uniref:VWFA domain-containing protein n=1 Tax=Gongylonema pulchrum TaxID=637853 RepID=A0A183D8B8_9BILA
LLTCDAARNRILLFVVDNSGALVNEYDLSKAYRLYEYIRNPASAVVDSLGNLLVLDYATGRLWALVSSARGARRLKEIVLPTPLGAQEALGIVAHVASAVLSLGRLSGLLPNLQIFCAGIDIFPWN